MMSHPLSASEGLPEVSADVPAPWTLNGSGLIVLLRTPAQVLAQASLSQAQKASLKSAFSVLMVVDYAQCEAGPYQELLWIPGSVLFGQERRMTISDIYVSTQVSVDNGRKNWGIPKKPAHFGKTQLPDGSTRVVLGLDGERFFEIEYQGFGPKMPIHTALVPKALRSLGQWWQGQTFFYSPSAKGQARLAKIHCLHSKNPQFPALTQSQVIAAFEIPRFEMVFPVSEVR